MPMQALRTYLSLASDHPYVVKSPWSYQFIRELLARPDIKLDGVLLPVRELTEAQQVASFWSYAPVTNMTTGSHHR